MNNIFIVQRSVNSCNIRWTFRYIDVIFEQIETNSKIVELMFYSRVNHHYILLTYWSWTLILPNLCSCPNNFGVHALWHKQLVINIGMFLINSSNIFTNSNPLTCSRMLAINHRFPVLKRLYYIYTCYNTLFFCHSNSGKL